MSTQRDPSRCNFHGLSVRMENYCPAMQPWLDDLCAPFAAAADAGVIAASGIVKPFEAGEVLRNVTPQAAPVALVDELAEVFSADERFWLVDERWGICQINLLKHQWRAWLLPTPSVDPVRQFEGAVLWPMAQLLKIRGLEMIPALSIQKEDWGGLILCPWDLGPEIRRLEGHGFRVVGRDWSMLRPRENRVELLGMPPLRGTLRGGHHRLGSAVECRAVFVVEPGRRAVTRGRTLSAADSPAILRRAWPLAELPPNRRRPGSAAAVLCRLARCVSVQLSRREADFVQLIESSRRRTGGARKILVAVSPAIRRPSQAIKSFRPLTLR